MAVMHIAKANAIHLEFKIKEKEKKSMVVSRSIVEAIGFLTGPLGCPIWSTENNSETISGK